MKKIIYTEENMIAYFASLPNQTIIEFIQIKTPVKMKYNKKKGVLKITTPKISSKEMIIKNLIKELNKKRNKK